MLTIPKIMALIKCQESDQILDLNPLRIFDTSVELYINMTIYMIIYNNGPRMFLLKEANHDSNSGFKNDGNREGPKICSIP